MTADRTATRWNGWGLTDETYELGRRAPAFWNWVATTLGMDSLPDTPAPSIDDMVIPDSRLTDSHREGFAAILHPDHVKTDKYERLFHARGKSYIDLVDIRQGKLEHVPDAVLYPGSAEEVRACLQYASDNQITVIPYGGGSSVVGAVTARGKTSTAPCVTLDTTRLDKIIKINKTDMTAKIEAGKYGPAIEQELQAEGVTLGHYPQSFEFSTLGGWISARGAGQQSGKYGKAEKWLVNTRLATPEGLWETEDFPASAAAPNLNQMIAGHEGTLGVITDAKVKIHPVPEAKQYRAFYMREFRHGVDVIRTLVQRGVPVAMARLSDPDETRFFQAVSTVGSNKALALKAINLYARRKAGTKPCLLLIGAEGLHAGVDAAMDAARHIVEARGGVHLGKLLADQWYKSRFHSPYLRDPLLDKGVGLDTLETATQWSNIEKLYREVMATLQKTMNSVTPDGQYGIVMCHVSHAYHDGASLYFTYVWPRDPNDPAAQWQRIKTAASDTIAVHGGTISHHHGVGTDHRPWLDREKGKLGMAALKAAKDVMDPAGILNPHKSFAD